MAHFFTVSSSLLYTVVDKCLEMSIVQGTIFSQVCGRGWWDVRHHTVHCYQLTVILVFVKRSSSCIHEKVGDSWHLQSKLFCYRRLHFFARTLCFLENCKKSTALDICEHQPGFLRTWVFSFHFCCILPLACCKRNKSHCIGLKGCNRNRVLYFSGLTAHTACRVLAIWKVD